MKRGVGLVEVLIAAAILAMGLLPIATSIQASARDARQLEAQTQALTRARGNLEAARVLGPEVFDRLLASAAEAPVPLRLPYDASGAAPVPGVVTLLDRMGAVEETVTVRVVRRHGHAGLYLLRSRFAWQNPIEPGRHQVELVTLVAGPLASIGDPTGVQ